MTYYIRTATPADAPAGLAVYAPFVEHTDVSFEISVPSVEEYEARIRQKLEHSTFLVAVDETSSRVVGFAYNGSFRERPAYDWASEISIYLAPEHQGCGLGSVLLDALEELMRAQGVVMSEACITSSNEASVAFHAKHGYAVCGEHHACGYEFWPPARRDVDGEAAGRTPRPPRAAPSCECGGDGAHPRRGKRPPA